jgi:hypothetical protein
LAARLLDFHFDTLGEDLAGIVSPIRESPPVLHILPAAVKSRNWPLRRPEDGFQKSLRVQSCGVNLQRMPIQKVIGEFLDAPSFRRTLGWREVVVAVRAQRFRMNGGRVGVDDVAEEWRLLERRRTVPLVTSRPVRLDHRFHSIQAEVSECVRYNTCMLL